MSWSNVSLEEISDLIMGQSPSSESYNDKSVGVPLVQGNLELKNGTIKATRYTSKPTKLSQAGDIIITVRAPVGELASSDGVYCLGRGVAAIRPQKINSKYQYYSLLGLKHLLTKSSQGSTFEAINSTELRSLKIDLPSEREQAKIATMLEAADESIVATQKVINQTERLKKALMQELLKRGIQYTRLGDVIKLEYGFPLQAAKRKTGNVGVYGSNGLVGYHDQSPLKGPGIIVGRKGSIGRVVWSANDYWPIDTTYYVETNEILRFIYYLLTDLKLQNYNRGTGVPGLNRDDVYSLSVPIPERDDQIKIAEILSTIDKKIEVNKKLNATQEELKNGLMQDLLSGKVRV